jgi:hypothetical protein
MEIKYTLSQFVNSDSWCLRINVNNIDFEVYRWCYKPSEEEVNNLVEALGKVAEMSVNAFVFNLFNEKPFIVKLTSQGTHYAK